MGDNHGPSTGTGETWREPSADNVDYVPVTMEDFGHAVGPFYHGTHVELTHGDELRPGHRSNYHEGRRSNNIYFSASMEAAVWGAELAVALTGAEHTGHIYVVEPTGPFEDDPNLTNKKFAGNPTRSYRSRHPLRVVSEVFGWQGHAPEVVAARLTALAGLRERGLDVIED